MINNLLLEAFKLGGTTALGISKNAKASAARVEAELDDLAKKFGFSGLSEFDRNISIAPVLHATQKRQVQQTQQRRKTPRKDRVFSREDAIDACVKALIVFGYPHVTSENIFTGRIERVIFRRMLEEAKGENKQADTVLDELIAELDATH